MVDVATEVRGGIGIAVDCLRRASGAVNMGSATPPYVRDQLEKAAARIARILGLLAANAAMDLELLPRPLFEGTVDHA